MLAEIHVEDGRRLSDMEARALVETVRESGAPARAIEMAREHAGAAREHLQKLTRGEPTDAVLDQVIQGLQRCRPSKRSRMPMSFATPMAVAPVCFILLRRTRTSRRRSA